MTTNTPMHADAALAIARDTGWNLDDFASDREWAAVAIGPVGQHRDSHALDRSNFDVIADDLRGRFGDAVDVARFRHWAVGWVDELTWDAGRDDVAAAVQDWRGRLASYPVADDDHFSALEWDENHPDGDDHCYADDDDCPCGRERA